MPRKGMTCLRSFRNPAIYDCVQLRVQIFRHKLGNQCGEGGSELRGLEHAGVACRDGPHLWSLKLIIILGSKGLVPRDQAKETWDN